MDAKEARTNSTLSSSVSDGSTKYAHNSPSLQGNRIQSYHDIGSNSLGKMDATTARPCAIIGPDRVLPSNSGEVYLKKTGEPWPCQENIYRHTTDYPNKISEYQPNRNISPRQTFQENMQRIMVPPTYSSMKIPDESSSKNTKLNMPQEAKYCDVPYNNPVSNELKSVRNSDIPMTNMNPAFGRSVPPYGWSPGVNVRPLRPYGSPEFYQYPEYPSCAGPRPMQMVRQHQALNGDATQVYPDHLYQEANIRFKPYPLAKERHQQIRYDYISNYPNTFHPPAPFPPHRYDLQKSIHGHPYPVYPQIPVKYLDRRIHEPLTDSYQRSPNLPNINMAYRNQTVPPTYGPLSGNCLQNKPYSDGSSKPSSKLPYDSNSKVYVDLEPKHSKGYPIPDNLYLNEMNHPQSMRGDILLPTHPSLNMHSVPQHAIYRKDNAYPKNFEYNIQCRNFDQSMNNSLPRFPLQYSPNTLAISPSDSSTSNDTAHTLGTSQEDCGYVSQSSTTSVRSLDSYNIQATNDALRRHNYNSYGYHKNNVIGKDITPKRKNSSSDKKNINVRQFLQMWNEGDDDVNESNKEVVTTNNSAKNNEEQLYVLGSMTVPSNEIGKYEHIQKISKLPENIKGYNSLELLNQYEELLEPCNTNKYANNKPLTSKQNSLTKNTINKEHIVTVPRPVSPLDVEAKISQSVIHKEVGCNFEIKPCSPEMLNVEVATPVQNILGERTIEKVINPVITHTPILQHGDENKMQNLTIKNASCKMISHPYIPEPSADKLKANNYSVQDLETNSGVCLASLPQLDNDIELNFPEINQQFINANQKGTNIQMPSKEAALLDADQNSNFLHEKSKYQPMHLLSPQTPFNSGTEREVSKLSKYRKNRRIEQRMPSPKDFSQSMISSVATQRIDSVIIKNPDNIKLQEVQDTNYVINTLLEDNSVNLDNNTLSLEKAIDFSLNKIEDDIPIDVPVLNIKHSENHVVEDHCNGITEYHNLNTVVKEDDGKSTLNLEEENVIADTNDHITTSDKINESVRLKNDKFSLKLAHIEDREHYELVKTSEKIPDDVEMQQDEFPLKVLQNNDFDESCNHSSKSAYTREDIEIKQDSMKLTQVDEEVHDYLTTSDNVTTASSKYELTNSLEGRYNACENVPETVEIIQEKLANVSQYSNHLNIESSTDICHVNRNISAENLNNALLPNSQAMSVIHVGEAVNKDAALYEIQTSNFNTNNHNVLKGNDVSVIKKNEQLSEISTDTLLENTNHCTGISLPMLENITDTQIDTISDNKPKSMENLNVNNINKLSSMQNDNICSEIKEENNSIIVQKDDVDSISAIKNFIDKTGNSTDTNVLNTVDVLDETLNIHSVLHILTNSSDSDKISNSCSITKSDEAKDENTEKNEESVVKEFDCSTDNIQLTKTISGTSTHSDNVAKIAISESQKLLQIAAHCNEKNDKEETVTDKLIDFKSESNYLFSFCPELLNADDKLNINTNRVINEVMHETTVPVQSTDLICMSELSDAHSPSYKNYRDNVIHNDVDTLSESSPSQKEDKIEANSQEISKNDSPNQNTGIIKEFENHIIIKNIDNDVKYYTKLTNNISCQNKNRVQKELFSPWIQKLMTRTVGIYKSFNTSHKEVIDETVKDDKEHELLTVEVKQDINVDHKENINEDTDKVVMEKICMQQNITDTKDTLLLVLSTDNSNGDFIPCNKVNECESIMHTSASEGTILKFEADLDREISVDTKLDRRSKIFENKPQRVLKRSLSESALHNIDSDSNVLYPSKRRKENDILQSSITAEDICKIVQNNRRNSVSTFYNEENVYILIDNDLIISEESDDSQKICYADTGECVQDECEPVFDKISESFSDSPQPVSVEIDNYNASTTNEDKSTEQSWVEDVACMETVFSDDVAEDITIDETMSPKISNDEDVETENDDSFIYQEMCESEHINKLRNIYGNSVSNENVQLLETLYRTPQMDVNKALDIESHNIRTDKSETDDFISKCSNLIDDKENLSNDLILTTDLKAYNDSVFESNVNDSFSNDKSLSECMVHSCETNDNFISNSQKDNSHYSYSSSPEVSSTTSEDKSILLKITSYNGSRSSQINEISADKISYKLTENKEYRSYKSNFSSTKTLITKAAQKYIPPLIETIGDLKVKLPLPQHRLNKLKQLKKTKIEPKISQNIIRYKNKNPQSDIPKKQKPKFEDVLKSIDEVHFKKRKDKSKKIKVEIPKVVIKKSEDGAHYTSALNKNEVYNPDLTGRKWQPWVFLDKNVFIDRMAMKKKYKAIYCHRKKTYVLADKFRKYKSVYNAKFVITQPRSDNPDNGNLKYTIRLQHK